MTAPEVTSPTAPPPQGSPEARYALLIGQLAAQSGQAATGVMARTLTPLELLVPSQRTLVIATIALLVLRARARARALAAARVRELIRARLGVVVPVIVPPAPPGEDERIKQAVTTLVERAATAAPPVPIPEPESGPDEPTRGDSERERIADRARERRADRAARDAEKREYRKARQADLRAERADQRELDRRFAEEARKDAALMRRSDQRDAALERDQARRESERNAKNQARADRREAARAARIQQQADRIARLAVSETRNADRDATLESAAAQNEKLQSSEYVEVPEIIEGWIRQLNGESCERCEQWADGRVRALGVPMKWHVSCDCTARLVWTKELDNDRHDKLGFTDLPEPVATKRDKFSQSDG